MFLHEKWYQLGHRISRFAGNCFDDLVWFSKLITDGILLHSYTHQLIVKTLSNRWITNTWRNCGCELRTTAIRIRYRGYASRIERVHKSFHIKVPIGWRSRRLDYNLKQVCTPLIRWEHSTLFSRKFHLFLLNKMQNWVISECLFLFSFQNGFILFSASWLQYNRWIICQSYRTKSKWRNVFNKNSSK